MEDSRTINKNYRRRWLVISSLWK